MQERAEREDFAQLATSPTLMLTNLRRDVLVPWHLEVRNVKSEPFRDTRGPGKQGFRPLLQELDGKRTPKAIRNRCALRPLYDLALRCREVVPLDAEDADIAQATLGSGGKEEHQNRFSACRKPPGTLYRRGWTPEAMNLAASSPANRTRQEPHFALGNGFPHRRQAATGKCRHRDGQWLGMLIPLLNPGRAKMALLNPRRTRLFGATAGGRASLFPLFYGVSAGVHLFSGGFGGEWF
jgi:hypothetical protein